MGQDGFLKGFEGLITVYIQTPDSFYYRDTVYTVHSFSKLSFQHSAHLCGSSGDFRLVHAGGHRLYRGPHRYVCCSTPGSRNGGTHAAGPALPHLEGYPAHHHLHCHQGKPDEIQKLGYYSTHTHTNTLTFALFGVM